MPLRSPLHLPDSHSFSSSAAVSVGLCRCGRVQVRVGSVTLQLTTAEAGSLATALRQATLAQRRAEAAPGN